MPFFFLLPIHLFTIPLSCIIFICFFSHFFLEYVCSWDILILFKVDIQSLPCTSKSCEERKSYMEGTHAYLAHVASLVSCYYFFLPMDCVIFSRLSIYNPTPLTLDNVILTTLTTLWSRQRIPDLCVLSPTCPDLVSVVSILSKAIPISSSNSFLVIL